MSTRRMTRETRVEAFGRRGWVPIGDGVVEMHRRAGFRLRTVERYVTEWVEVVE